MRTILIQGREVDLDKLNPKLKRVVRERGFMFWYSDVTHTEHNDEPHREYRDYSDKHHTEHTEKYNDYVVHYGCDYCESNN
jgi:hypothetical protein